MNVDQRRQFKTRQRYSRAVPLSADSIDMRFSTGTIHPEDRQRARLAILAFGTIFVVTCIAYLVMTVGDRLA